MLKFSATSKKDSSFEVGIDKRLIPSLALVALVISTVGFFVNFLMRLNHLVSIVSGTAILIYFLLYLYSRKAKYLMIVKWVLVIFSIILFNFLWYYNNGSRGPALYIFVIIYSFFIFVFSGKGKLVLSVIASLNILILFLVEFNNPDVVGHYYTDHDRIIDVYSALLYYGLIFYVFLTVIHDAYFKQYQKAKTADQLKSSFLANMSHEIRTPLNAIVGFSNLLADGTIKEEERKQYISIINSSNETLLQLIDDILDVSMIEANQVKINKTDFSLSKLMQNLEKTYIPILVEKKQADVHLKLKLPERSLWINSDKIRINQVLVNLLNNAIKFTHWGAIELGYTLESNHIRFYVKDTGIGIEQPNLEHLFERFYKIEDDNRKLYRGTGIGLYLCKKIVEILGGTIHASSEYGKGSIFYFYIPAENLTIESAAMIAKNTTEKSKNEVLFPKGTVLIIEDDDSSRIYFKKVLEEINLKIIEATEGQEGIRLFSENPDISVVLLDIQLPGDSGFDIIKVLKEIRPGVPVLAQTAFAMAGDEENCLAAGFDDYIAKPVKKEALIKKLQRFL